MKIVDIAPWSLALLAIACGSDGKSPAPDRAGAVTASATQSLTRTVLLSANFETGLAPFTNTDGKCVGIAFAGSTGNGVACFGNTILSVEIDATRFSDLQFRYTRGTSSYEANDFFFAQRPTGELFNNNDLIQGSSPVAAGGFDLLRLAENSKFTLNFVAATAADGSGDLDAFLFDEFVVTGTPVPDDDCDGKDDDGDGLIDEDFVGVVTQCGIGACANSAPQICKNAQKVDNCVPKPPAPDDSTCNRIDDDCDNRIDEDSTCGPPLTEQGQVVKGGKFLTGCSTQNTTCSSIPDVGPHSACRVAGGTAASGSKRAIPLE